LIKKSRIVIAFDAKRHWIEEGEPSAQALFSTD